MQSAGDHGPRWRSLLSKTGLSPKTSANYVPMLRRVQRFCVAEGLELDRMTLADVERFISIARPGLRHPTARSQRPQPLLVRRWAERRSHGAGALPAEIAGRPQFEVREPFRRRGLSAKDGQELRGHARQARSRSCEAERWSSTTSDRDALYRFAATLKQTRSTLMTLRVAVSTYWKATGRKRPPELDVSSILGRSGRDPEEGRAALERARRPSWAASQTISQRGRRWAGIGNGLDRLLARQLSRKTARNYLKQLARFGRWCNEIGTTSTPRVATGHELEEYACTLPDGRSMKALTRSALVQYWAITERDDPPLWGIRVPRKRPMRCRALDEDVAVQLATAVERDDRKGLAVVIGLYMGLRRFEIAKLKWSDFEGWLAQVRREG